MGKVHRTLHLQHRHHTGHRLHHKHTSYRGLAVVFGLATIFIVGLGAMARATADSLVVYARNPAPVPTSPAVITRPSDGTITHTPAVTIAGSCPAVTPEPVIVIIDNGVEIGSAPCDSSYAFTVPITLASGPNTLLARTYTITGDTGPDSTPITITYVPVAASKTTTVTSTPATALTFVIDQPFIVFGPGKDALWTGTIGGGTSPYHVTIDWGDGSLSNYRFGSVGAQQFRHHYRVMQAYSITATVTSADGQRVSRDYAAVTPYVPPVSLFTASKPWGGGSMLLGLYGAYLLVLAVFGIVWLKAHPYAYARVPARGSRVAAKRKRS